MPANSESRSRYLALALASRNAINSLMAFKKVGTADEQLRDALRDVVESLRATTDQNNLFGAPPTESPFAHYEQTSALEEVVKTLKDKDIIQHLSHVLTATHDERENDIAEALQFFFALESRALHHYGRQIGAREA
jgi:hypothetical protein